MCYILINKLSSHAVPVQFGIFHVEFSLLQINYGVLFEIQILLLVLAPLNFLSFLDYNFLLLIIIIILWIMFAILRTIYRSACTAGT